MRSSIKHFLCHPWWATLKVCKDKSRIIFKKAKSNPDYLFEWIIDVDSSTVTDQSWKLPLTFGHADD